MGATVKRRYDATRRRLAAAENRRMIIDAAREIFFSRGYRRATMAAVAARAGVAVDTVYELVGPKPALFGLLIDAAISNADHPVPLLERDYIEVIRTARGGAAKLEAYAAAITRIQERLAPLYEIIHDAPDAVEARQIWDRLLARRAQHMPLLVEEIARTGELRPGVSIESAATDVWVLNSTEVYVLLTRKGALPSSEYEPWLAARLKLLLLKSGAPS